jgi:predicted MarR family transcription regulator
MTAEWRRLYAEELVRLPRKPATVEFLREQTRLSARHDARYHDWAERLLVAYVNEHLSAESVLNEISRHTEETAGVLEASQKRIEEARRERLSKFRVIPGKDDDQ